MPKSNNTGERCVALSPSCIFSKSIDTIVKGWKTAVSRGAFGYFYRLETK